MHSSACHTSDAIEREPDGDLTKTTLIFILQKKVNEFSLFFYFNINEIIELFVWLMFGNDCGKSTDTSHAFVSCDEEGSKDALCQFMAALSINDCKDEIIKVKEEPITVEARSVDGWAEQETYSTACPRHGQL